MKPEYTSMWDVSKTQIVNGTRKILSVLTKEERYRYLKNYDPALTAEICLISENRLPTWSKIIKNEDSDFLQSTRPLAIMAPADFNLKYGLTKEFARNFGKIEFLFNQRRRVGHLFLKSTNFLL